MVTPERRARNRAAAPAGCALLVLAAVVMLIVCGALQLSGALPWQHDKPHSGWIAPSPTQVGDR